MVGSFPGCCARAAIGHACRAAEQRDELAAFHCPMPPVLSTERIAHLDGRRLPRCGISIQPMSQLGHPRHFEREVGMRFTR